MRFARLPFGNRSRLFLLNITVRHHLAKCGNLPICADLRDNLYVDDWLSGADNEEEAFRMFTSAQAIMEGASLSLVKWSSNSEFVVDVLAQQSDEEHLLSVASKILGVK